MKKTLDASAVLVMTDCVWCYFLIYLPAPLQNAKNTKFVYDCSSAILNMEKVCTIQFTVPIICSFTLNDNAKTLTLNFGQQKTPLKLDF